jgi:hypothetical protein
MSAAGPARGEPSQPIFAAVLARARSALVGQVRVDRTGGRKRSNRLRTTYVMDATHFPIAWKAGQAGERLSAHARLGWEDAGRGGAGEEEVHPAAEDAALYTAMRRALGRHVSSARRT